MCPSCLPSDRFADFGVRSIALLPTGILGFFHAGRKRASLFLLQGPAGHRLLPGLRLTLPPYFWNGCKQQEALILIHLNLVLLCLNNCFSWFPPQSVVLMREVLNTKQHNWIIHAITGMGVAICVVTVKHGMDQPASKDLLFLVKNF